MTGTRVAGPEDLYDLMPLVKRFWKEGNYTDLRFDPEYIANQYRNLLSNDNIRVFVYEDEGYIVGLLVGALMPQAFSSDPMAYEIAWYVAPEARGSSAAMRLIKTYEQWATDNGCKLLNMSRIEGLDDEKLHSFYSKSGFKVVEHTYVKDL